MRVILLAGTSLLALSVSAVTASALPLSQTFSYTGSIVDYTVPTDGYYDISATGAQGGTEPYTVLRNATGGYGAEVGGQFLLTGGEVLQLTVGGQGGNGPGFAELGAGGGGGGSFVIGSDNAPLLIAGGGGGGGQTNGLDGVSATSTSATNGNGGSYGSGAAGAGGHGGSGGSTKGTGGGGGTVTYNGGAGTSPDGGAGGSSFAAGSGGGAGSGRGGGGGFGGGGGGGHYGGGGGGGANGGGGGGYGGFNSVGYGGGAGGSFNAGTFQTFATATGGGNGSITIGYYGPPPDYLAPPSAVPEPASLALFGSGALALLAMRRSRRR